MTDTNANTNANPNVTVPIAGGSVTVGNVNPYGQPNGDLTPAQAQLQNIANPALGQPYNPLDGNVQVQPQVQPQAQQQVQTQVQPQTEPKADELKTEPKVIPAIDGASPEDIMVSMLSATTGVTEEQITQVMLNALKYNDSNLIDFEGLYSQAKITDEAHKQHIKAVVSQLYTSAKAKEAEIANTAHTKAGGKEQWQQAVQAFNANATPAQLIQASALADAGFVSESIDMVLNTVRGLGVVSHANQQAVQASSQVGSPQVFSEADYKAGIASLMNNYGINFLSHPKGRAEYEALTIKRQNSKQ